MEVMLELLKKIFSPRLKNNVGDVNNYRLLRMNRKVTIKRD